MACPLFVRGVSLTESERTQTAMDLRFSLIPIYRDHMYYVCTHFVRKEPVKKNKTERSPFLFYSCSNVSETIILH